jgi:cell division protein FtsW
MKSFRADRPFLAAVLALALGGFFIFSSASLGLLARDGAQFGSIALNQGLGLLIGLTLMYGISKVQYRFWRKHAFYIFLTAIVVNLLLFIPGLGFTHGGATRWLDLGFISFQPSELLKIGFIIYFAAWLSGVREKAATFKYGLMPFLIILGLLGLLLLGQSDTDTLVVIVASGLAMFIAGGGRWRDFFILTLICIAGVTAVAFLRPYVMERVMTFLHPTADPLGAGYQIQQSLIAIGSGETFGRGFGQSVQKFNYLPEPIGDSIFAVAAEEFGFVGTTVMVSLFLFFALRSLKIASRTGDGFGSLVVVGISVLVITECFMNIAAMLGVIPLSGMPLLFVSHGGTALMIVLAEMGIILNVSKYAKKD